MSACARAVIAKYIDAADGSATPVLQLLVHSGAYY
jgi:hypothetical protein